MLLSFLFNKDKGSFMIKKFFILVVGIIAFSLTNAGSKLLVGNSYNNSVTVVDINSMHKIGLVTVGIVPHQIVKMPNTEQVYIADKGTVAGLGTGLAVVNLNPLKLVKIINTQGCQLHALLPYQQKVYFACLNGNTIRRYDPATGKIDWEATVGKRPHDVLLVNKTIYTSNQGDNTVGVLDINTK